MCEFSQCKIKWDRLRQRDVQKKKKIQGQNTSVSVFLLNIWLCPSERAQRQARREIQRKKDTELISLRYQRGLGLHNSVVIFLQHGYTNQTVHKSSEMLLSLVKSTRMLIFLVYCIGDVFHFVKTNLMWTEFDYGIKTHKQFPRAKSRSLIHRWKCLFV